MTQLKHFITDVKRTLGKNKLRIIHIWMSRAFWGLLLYRSERQMYLAFRRYYGFLRIPFIPIVNLIQAYSNIDIHYKANIDGGIVIFHPAAGCVISGQSKIGKNLSLTGGNIIGCKRKPKEDSFTIGDNCSFGANATLIGPLKLGNNISIGASACVTKSFLQNDSTLVGVPATILTKNY